MPVASGPLILLSPAKSLDFTKPLTAALASVTPTQPRMLQQTAPLSRRLSELSKTQLKSLMSLSDSLAQLNADRYSNFEAQTERLAIGALRRLLHQRWERVHVNAIWQLL